jgi:hypothetical protein
MSLVICPSQTLHLVTAEIFPIDGAAPRGTVNLRSRTLVKGNAAEMRLNVVPDGRISEVRIRFATDADAASPATWRSIYVCAPDRKFIEWASAESASGEHR